jgi:hypothetical protein
MVTQYSHLDNSGDQEDPRPAPRHEGHAQAVGTIHSRVGLKEITKRTPATPEFSRTSQNVMTPNPTELGDTGDGGAEPFAVDSAYEELLGFRKDPW